MKRVKESIKLSDILRYLVVVATFCTVIILMFAGMLKAFVYFTPQKPKITYQEKMDIIGIVKGQTNEIWLGKTLFRIPSNVHFTVTPTDPVEKGHVDKFGAPLLYSQYFDPIYSKTGYTEYDAYVRVEIWKSGYEVPSEWDARIPRPGKSTVERSDLGLREFHNESFSGAWGYISYTPLDESYKTPKGSKIFMECEGYPKGAPLRCWTGFQHPKGPRIKIVFSAKLLPHWREVHQDVVHHVDSLIVK